MPIAEFSRLDDSAYGYANVSLSQGTVKSEIVFNTSYLLTELATIGGQAIALFAIGRFCLEGYTSFTYYKSALKKLYFESTSSNSAQVDGVDSYQDVMRSKISNRKDIQFSWFLYAYLKIVSKLCCCCKCLKKKDGWHDKKLKRLKKFDIACSKLDMDTDMSKILQSLRISRLVQKVILSRRQRLSVHYF